MATASRVFHVMSKPTGAICNLDCEYCFFLSKEELYPGSGFRMPEDVHEAYISQLLAAQRGADEVVVAFQGGEPTLMGIDFFRRTLELEARYAAPGQVILNTLQTNATLIDDEWAAFLAEHGFLVGVSIDGPRAMHDVYRVDKGGKPTFDRVIAGLDALKRHGVEWNALVTVNSVNGDHGREVYTFLRDDLGATFMQLIPIVEHEEGESASARSVSGRQYGRFLIDVFEEWARHDVGDVFVQMFDTALAHWMGMDQAGMCVHARTCGDAVALEHNGDLYSCDHYVDPDYLLGNITAGAHAAAARRVAAAARLRAGEGGHPSRLLPLLRRALRLQRWLPEGPVPDHTRRGARAALPVRGLPGVLPPRRRAHEGDARSAAQRTGRDGRARLVRRADAKRRRP